MLPLSVRLRVTRPALDYQVPDSERWADQWVGFRLDGPGGRLGAIEAVGFDPGNWRACLAACPHRPVRATNRGNPIRGHRVDRPDPGQGDRQDCRDLARNACVGGRAGFGPSRGLSVGLGRVGGCGR